MAQKDSKNQQYLIIGLIAYLVVVFVTLHYLSIAAQNPALGLFAILERALSETFTAPFSLAGAFSDAGKSFRTIGLVTLVFGFGAIYMYTNEQSKKHENSDTALGSAGWMSDYKSFNADFVEERPKNKPELADPNLILAKGVKYGLVPGRNVNVMIIGSAGSGKSFGVIKPNILQMNSSFVVTDPSGELFRAEGTMLMEHGYDVKIFSTSSMLHSHCYNPFDYVYDEDGQIDETRVASMISMFLANATDLQNNKGDKFWDQASKALLNSCAMLLLEFYPVEKHNMYEMLRLVQKGKVSERDESQTELDQIFANARKINPDAHCFSSYDTFKLAPARTANSILISAGVDLDMFHQDQVRNLTTTSYQVQTRNLNGDIRTFAKDAKGNLIRTDDNLDIRTIGDRKTAIFINIPQANGTYNFLVSMLYSQLFESLYGRAEKICPTKWMIVNESNEPILTMIDSEEDAVELIHIYQNASIDERIESGKKKYYIQNVYAPEKFCIPGMLKGTLQKVYSKEVGEKYLSQFKNCTVVKGRERLPVHVQCLLDEFSNIGTIPEFPQKLATMRKYEISCMIVLQSLAQLKNRYDKLWADILSNCDCMIFLGTSDPETCKYISERLGFRTIKTASRSRNSGKGGGGMNISLQKRELMTQEEVSRMNSKKCIVMINGQRPFLATKFRALDHENWSISGDVKKDARVEISEFITCTNKLLGADTEARVVADTMLKAATGKNMDGERLTEAKPMKNPKEVVDTITQVAGKSALKAGDFAKSMVPFDKPKKPKPPVEDIDDETPPIPQTRFANKKKRY